MRNLRLLLLLCLAGFTALAVGAAPRKVRVSEPAAAEALMTQGGKLIADYGAFRLIEIDDAQPLNTKSAALQSADDTDVIELNTQALNTRSAKVKALRRAVGGFTGKKLHLIHFAGPVKPEWCAAIEQVGARIVAYVPQNAYLIYGDAAALTAVQSWADGTNVVQWEGSYADDYKIHPQARTINTRGLPQTPATDVFAIQLVDDASANAATLALIDQIKLEPIKRQFQALDYLNVIVRLPVARLAEIAALPEVVSIQPYVEPQKRDERQDMIIAGNITGVGPSGPGYLAWLAGKGFTQSQFTSSSFAVDITDSGVDNGTTAPGHFGLYVGGNPGLGSRMIYNRLEGIANAGSTLAGCDGHGNLNTHIIGGYNDFAPGFPHTDAAGFHYGLGVCPFVKIGSSVIFDPSSFTFPTYANLQSRAYQDGARISANSWGAPVGGAYNVDSQAYDALVRDAQPTGSSFAAAGNQQMVIVFAAGNSGPAASTIGSPGTGKNVITVGASENVHPHAPINGGNDPSGYDRCGVPDSGADNLNDIIYFSSRGPCTDGRMKPDLVAPGTHVTGGVGQSLLTTSGTGSAISCFSASSVCALPGGGGTDNPNNFFPLGQQFYTTSSGTSHSTPAVAGACALLRQYFINQTLPPPSPAMTKAYLMNSTRYLTGVDANDTLWSPNQGMGELNLGTALDGVPRMLTDQATTNKFTATGQTRVFTGTVVDPTKPFRVTLAWTDAPGSTAGNAFNNDLDLTVTVAGNTYKGNVFSGAYSITGGTADARNNVESVVLPAGTTNTFTVTVTAANLNSDGVPNEAPSIDQDFALVIYNALTPPAITPSGYSVSGEGCLPGNGAVDAGETVTVNFSFINAGMGNTTNLVVTLLSTNGVQSPSGPQTYGTIVAGGGAVTRAFTFTAGGACGGSITPTFQLQEGPANLGLVSQTLPLGATVIVNNRFTNATALTLPSSGSASVYPTAITVSNVVGLVTNVTVTLQGINHTNPDDIDALLVGPGGQSVLLMSDVGGTADLNGVTLTFDSSAADSLPNGSQISTGTYKPTNFDSSSDGFSSPAPASGYGNSLAVYSGLNPNGTWSLYLRDDTSGNVGSLAQGWSLNVMTSNLVCCSSGGNLADLAISTSISTALPNVGSNVTVTLTVTNRGPNATSLATVTEVLPSGFAFIAATTSQGTLTNYAGTITGTLGPLTNNASAVIVITANAAIAGSYTNHATVSSVTTDPVLANNDSTMAVSVNAFPTISSISNQVTDEDVTPAPLGFVIGDAETSAAALVLGKFSSNPTLVPPANIVISGSGSNRTLTITPEANASGNTTITLTVNDGVVTVSRSFLFTVVPVNDAPTLAPLSDRIVFEGQALVITNVAADVDSPPYLQAFTLLGAPSNATINASTGLLLWTPTEAQGPGTNQFAVVVNDNGTPNLTATQSVTVIVLESNLPPVLPPITNQFVMEGQTLVITNTATDPDLPVNSLTYSLGTNGLPAGAQIDSTNGVFAWTPSESQGPSTNQIQLIVRDDGTPSLSVTQILTVVVLESNRPPTLAAIPDITILEGTLLIFTNSTSDPDLPANNLTYTLDTNSAPAGAAVDTATGVFTWTPSEAQGPSANQISIIVADHGAPSLTATQNFTVVVLESNLTPVLADITNYTVFVGQTLAFTNFASDPDWPPNNLTFHLQSSPTNAVLDPITGIFSWTPDQNEALGTHHVAVIVSDDGSPSLSATQTFKVMVLQVNIAPELAAVLNHTISEGETLSLTNFAADANLPAQTLTFSLGASPTNAMIDAFTGVFTWTPTEAQGPSTNLIEILVADDGVPSLTATQSFTVVVLESNSPPVLLPQLSSLLNPVIYEGEPYAFTNLVSDPDLPANTLTFTLQAAPLGAVLNPTNGVFTWTPDETQGGSTNQITMVVSDDGTPGLSVTQMLTVVVLEANHVPLLAPIADRLIHAGTSLTITNSATDPDFPANTLTYSLDAGSPATATIDPASGIFHWTSSDADGDIVHHITVRVTDDGVPNLSAAQSFLVTVRPRPVIESITFTNDVANLTWSAIAGQTYRLQYKFNLNDANWNDLAPDFVASGETTTNSHSVGMDAQRFYRIMLVQ